MEPNRRFTFQPNFAPNAFESPQPNSKRPNDKENEPPSLVPKATRHSDQIESPEVTYYQPNITPSRLSFGSMAMPTPIRPSDMSAFANYSETTKIYDHS